jgi:hypothetical protein
MVGGNMAPRMPMFRPPQMPSFGPMQAPGGFQVGPGMQQVLQSRGFGGFQAPQPMPTFPRAPQPMLQGSGGWGMAGGNMGGFNG